MPETDSQSAFKRLLLQPGWRKCTGCGLRRLDLEIYTTERSTEWLCYSCRGRLIYSAYTKPEFPSALAEWMHKRLQAKSDALSRATRACCPPPF